MSLMSGLLHWREITSARGRVNSNIGEDVAERLIAREKWAGLGFDPIFAHTPPSLRDHTTPARQFLITTAKESLTFPSWNWPGTEVPRR